MAKFLMTMKAIIIRLIFALHGILIIKFLISIKRNMDFLYLGCPILLLFFEGILTLLIKKNQEWKWFSPSVFLYLSSVIPATWLLELHEVNEYLNSLPLNNMLSINITQTYLHIISANITDSMEEYFIPYDTGFKKVDNIYNLFVEQEEIRIELIALSEQILMLILIIARWMLPKGGLSRIQLSQLLLVYIGIAADIIEFLDSSEKARIGEDSVLVYTTLGIWTWSLMQFAVVPTITKQQKPELSPKSVVRKKVQMETFTEKLVFASSIIFQDGPFLLFCLVLIFHYWIVSYMNIFFACKNVLVISLHLYRFYAVQSENTNESENENGQRKSGEAWRMRLPNISIISKDDVYGNLRTMISQKDKGREEQRDKDVEANYAGAEDATEKVDNIDSSPKNVTRSKGEECQEIERCAMDSRSSSKQVKLQKRKKGLLRRKKPRRSVSDDAEMYSRCSLL